MRRDVAPERILTIGGILVCGMVYSEADLRTLVGRFFAQLLCIVFLSHSFQYGLTRIFCKSVFAIPPICVGILLGPQALGKTIPGISRLLFSEPSSLNPLHWVANNAAVLILVVFVGYELAKSGAKQLSGDLRSLLITLWGLTIPVFCGCALALWTFYSTTIDVNLLAFVIFFAVVLSFSSLPILKLHLRSSLQDSNITGFARRGVIVENLFLWILLFLGITIGTSATSFAALAVTMNGIAWSVFMLLLFKPLLAMVVVRCGEGSPWLVILGLLAALYGSAWICKQIGLHEVFGAFLIGFSLPKTSQVKHTYMKRMKAFFSLFLVPIYFASLGLQVDITQLANTTTWSIAIIGSVTIVLGKVLGCLLPSWYLTQLDLKGSLTLGCLMSSRGLMEFVVLGVGLSLNILNTNTFTLLLAMATLATLLSSLVASRALAGTTLASQTQHSPSFFGKDFSILLCISNRPEAIKLFSFTKGWLVTNQEPRVKVMRLIESDNMVTDRTFEQADSGTSHSYLYAPPSYERLLQVESDFICKFNNKGERDVCNIGGLKTDLTIVATKTDSSLEKMLKGALVRYVLKYAKETNVGILVTSEGERKKKNKVEEEKKRKVLVVYYGNGSDDVVLKIARKIAKESNSTTKVSIICAKERDGNEGKESEDEEKASGERNRIRKNVLLRKCMKNENIEVEVKREEESIEETIRRMQRQAEERRKESGSGNEKRRGRKGKENENEKENNSEKKQVYDLLVVAIEKKTESVVQTTNASDVLLVRQAVART